MEIVWAHDRVAVIVSLQICHSVCQPGSEHKSPRAGNMVDIWKCPPSINKGRNYEIKTRCQRWSCNWALSRVIHTCVSLENTVYSRWVRICDGVCLRTTEHNEHLNIYTAPLMLIEICHTLSRTSLSFHLMLCAPQCSGTGGRVDTSVIRKNTHALQLDALFTSGFVVRKTYERTWRLHTKTIQITKTATEVGKNQNYDSSPDYKVINIITLPCLT